MIVILRLCPVVQMQLKEEMTCHDWNEKALNMLELALWSDLQAPWANWGLHRARLCITIYVDFTVHWKTTIFALSSLHSDITYLLRVESGWHQMQLISNMYICTFIIAKSKSYLKPFHYEKHNEHTQRYMLKWWIQHFDKYRIKCVMFLFKINMLVAIWS